MPLLPMLWLLYNLLFLLAFLVVLPKFLWRMVRRGGYARNFGQRFGWYHADVREALAERGRIWIHAVSVGELFVALSLIRALRQRDSGLRFVISTTTSTGYRILQQEVDDSDVGIYFPLDFPPIMRRVMRRIRPLALVLVEGEFWPNLVRTANRRGVPLFLVNGRISERSFRGYRRLRPFTRRIFRLFETLCVQSETDRERLLALGAPPDSVRVLNSAKYELGEDDPVLVEQAGSVLGEMLGEGRRVLLGGSTWPGEETVLVEIYRRARERFPDLALVLAPRHVERKAQVVEALRAGSIPFCQRSDWDSGGPPADVDAMVLDTTGELRHYYAHADLIFVGKSLCSEGGQNIIEPAQFGKAVVVGPHMKNFPVVMDDFLQAKAIRQVRTAEELETTILGLLDAPEAMAALGENAARLIREKSGAITHTAALVLETISGESPA